jgi:hypothetical protein
MKTFDLTYKEFRRGCPTHGSDFMTGFRQHMVMATEMVYHIVGLSGNRCTPLASLDNEVLKFNGLPSLSLPLMWSRNHDHTNDNE